MTDKIKERKKNKKTVSVIERTFTLDTLINDTSAKDVAQRRHNKARDDFRAAVDILTKGGKIFNIGSKSNAFEEWYAKGVGKNGKTGEWYKNGEHPGEFKTWAEFYKKTKVVLFLIKEI